MALKDRIDGAFEEVREDYRKKSKDREDFVTGWRTMRSGLLRSVVEEARPTLKDSGWLCAIEDGVQENARDSFVVRATRSVADSVRPTASLTRLLRLTPDPARRTVSLDIQGSKGLPRTLEQLTPEEVATIFVEFARSLETAVQEEFQSR
jgi:hypothetical protein